MSNVFSRMFGSSKPAGTHELRKMREMLQQQYSPYQEAGMRQLPTMEEQYGQLVGDPGAMLSRFGQGFQADPGYQFQVDEATRAANAAAARGGMAGSPQHQTDIARTITGLADQQYQNYLKNALGLYGTGLSGMQNLFGTGFQATNQLAGGLGSSYLSEAELQRAQDAQRQQMLSNILGQAMGSQGGGAGGGAGGWVDPDEASSWMGTAAMAA